MAGQCLSNEIAVCLSSGPSLALRRLPRFDYGPEFYALECEVAEITQTPNAHISQPGPGLEGPIWLRNGPKGSLYDRRQFERSPVARYCNISLIFLPSRFLNLNFHRNSLPSTSGVFHAATQILTLKKR